MSTATGELDVAASPTSVASSPTAEGGSEADESGTVVGAAGAATGAAAATRLDFRLKKHTCVTLRSRACSGVPKRRPSRDQIRSGTPCRPTPSDSMTASSLLLGSPVITTPPDERVSRETCRGWRPVPPPRHLPQTRRREQPRDAPSGSADHPVELPAGSASNASVGLWDSSTCATSRARPGTSSRPPAPVQSFTACAAATVGRPVRALPRIWLLGPQSPEGVASPPHDLRKPSRPHSGVSRETSADAVCLRLPFPLPHLRDPARETEARVPPSLSPAVSLDRRTVPLDRPGRVSGDPRDVRTTPCRGSLEARGKPNRNSV